MHQATFSPAVFDQDNTQPLPINSPPYSSDDQEVLVPHLLLSVVDHIMTQPEEEEEDMEEEEPPLKKRMPIPAPQPMQASLTQDLRDQPQEVATTTEDSQRCLLDFVEWWCHKVIAASTTDDIQEAETEMLRAMENFGGATSANPCEFGRLANRIEIAAVSYDVALLGDSKETAACSVDQHWGLLREQLILLKSKLLRQDANADVVLLTPDEQQPLIKGVPDPTREASALFTTQYKHVVRLIQVQQQLTLFQQKLKELVQTCNTSSESKRLVREAIEYYETQINLLFSPATTQSTNKQGQEDDEDTESVQSNVTQLPQELVGFLLKDLYQSSANTTTTTTATTNSSDSGAVSPSSDTSSKASSTTATALAERLLSDVESVLNGAASKKEYSQATCQKAVRQLLQDWHDQVLEPPTLVQLGYGDSGDSSSAPSSNKARKAIAEEDAMLRRLSMEGEQQVVLEDDDDDTGDAKPNFPKFVPIQWVDSDDDDSEIFEPPPDPKIPPHTPSSCGATTPFHSSTRKRSHSRPIVATLETDSEDEDDDPEVTIEPNPRKRQREQPPAAQDEPKIRLSSAQAQAIQEGVRKFGLGRWRMVQQQAQDGLLDKLTPQNIKLAYQQMKRKSSTTSSTSTHPKNKHHKSQKKR